MGHIFVGYAEEDSSVASEIAACLEAIDSVPGPSYLLQMGQAIDDADAVVLIISAASVLSNQVTSEVIRGHEQASVMRPFGVNGHTTAVPSLLPVASRLPSGLYSTSKTQLS